MDAEERKKNIELYGSGYDLLMAALAEVPQEAMTFKPEPNEWSVHEIIIHLADSESIAAQQARLMVAEPGRTLMDYSPDAWADNLHYRDANAEEALQLLKLIRAFTYRWFKSLPEEAFALSAIYPGDDDPYALDDLLFIYAKHIPSHINQIENNMKLWRER